MNANNSVRTEYGYQAAGQAVPYSIKEDSAGGWTGVAVIDPAVGTLLGVANYSGGGLIKQYAPDPWGRQTTVDTGVKVRLRMAGQEYDAETGLYHMGARYYDPDAGRFISEDPVGLDGGLNLYSYALNNPILNRDPSGTDVVAICSWTYHLYFTNYADGTFTFDSVTYDDYTCTVSSDGSGSSDIGGSPGFDPTRPKTTTCTGMATYRGVGGNQAQDDGALYSQYPAQAGGSIRGGTFGTVAVQNGFLGLTTRQLRTYGAQIRVTPSDQARIARYGGPTGALSVSDYGDANIQATQGVAFDIYRFPTVTAGTQFGRETMMTTITFPTESGGSCPAGFTEGQ